jgi:hypothetical protein
MRIFPERTEEWLEPGGTAMQVIAIFALVIAFVAFGWRMYNLSTWHNAEGEIISAQLVHRHNNDGQTLCSAAYKVRFLADGAPHVLSTEFSTATSDCSNWEQRVAQMPGTKETVLYNPANPDSAYVNGGKSAQFFIVAIVCGGLGLGFGIGGTALKTIGRRMQKRGLAMP